MKYKIDIDNWERKKTYIFFGKYTNPYASVTSQVNVDSIVRYAKENNISFYGIMSYVVAKTINELDEYKYVLEEDGVYKYDKMNVSFTSLNSENILNFSRTVEYNQDMDIFLKEFEFAKKETEGNQKIPYDSEKNKIYITCFPWRRFTSLDNPKNGIDSNPRICWGKYFLDNNEYMIDVSIQVNHAFQDGYHLARFFTKLEENSNNIFKKENGKVYTLHRSR